MLRLQSVPRTKAALQKGVAGRKYAYTKADVKGKVIAIRREDQSVWERRAAFSPANVRRLTRAGVKVIVQPSNRRAYPMQTYANAGAVIQEDISEASTIFGVKQVPVDQLLPEKTYCLFSHTIKAQEANMALLDAILAKKIRLIDYEKLMDEKGQRVVAFGKYAGVAGMVNILHGLGLRLLALGHHTPFMHIGPAHNYRNSMMARQAIRDAGYEISLGMMPRSIGPITFVFTGSGNVSQGAQEVFQELPHEYVPPEMLKKVAEHGVPNKLYCCEVRRRHHLERKEGGGFDSDEYIEHPELDSPKLLTIPDAKTLLRPAHTPWLPSSIGAPSLPHRMLAICDISADPGGSIEFMNECTTIDTPFCLYDADRNKDTKSFKGPGVLVCSIDNMPTQLPRESTDFFGNLLYPYAYDIICSDAKKPLEEHSFSQAVHGAIIASNGDLTPNFQYIRDLRNQQHAPTVEYLHKDGKIKVTVASAVKEEADALASKYPGVESVFMNVMERPDHLNDLVLSADMVISLLPYSLHHHVAECCINTKTHMVTASYCTAEMKELHQRALDAGITIVNEVGLDPGIDHLLAMECFDEIRQGGGKIESFVSYCGGLPAPECSENPLRYKFSWSPRGVLLNTLGEARYLKDGKTITIQGGGELMNYVHGLDFLPGFALEGFANRDSLSYIEAYGLHDAHTVLRGTLRYNGFSETIKSIQKLGLISTEPKPSLHPNGPDITWRQFISGLIGVTDNTILYENLRRKIAQHLGSQTMLESIEQLGLLENDKVIKLNTPLDTLSHYLSKKLVLGPQDRDIIILRHEIGILWGDSKREKRGINMVLYGQRPGEGHSAMSKAVGFPAAITAKMVMDEKRHCLPFHS
ncbi:aminoadipic semialdehyde synthase, putative [Pediculus humanus corporis]|uniref:Aminoadipic semialdehyde synthase, putative n=1 Tax=Pediculus humanus subsp. corporis TaxID=121224 RepID=E0V9L4_PEDHC|nr:aminoadipic semialdehyde synthase, putative [Pediculus humanus corporis]EEB10070.1 aminoadipic semialdehyde synthase, putative [Pediculus humanus corporis]